ncbi:MAG TPA: hypothetical protein VMU15_17505 [Anaeromyxobacter sp.]|nr:hypothetical protein [Anaeromyxobacter sp.]
MIARAATAAWLIVLGAARADPPPGPRAQGPEWAVAAEPGASGGPVVDLRVEARAGFHVNLEYPMAFSPSPSATARFQGTRVPLRPARTAACPGDGKEVCSATLELPYLPPPAGAARVAGTLAFSVCSAERCLIQKVPLSLEVASPAPRG